MSQEEATDKKVVDLFGREITAGCNVVYPARRGSSMWLRTLRVQQVIGGVHPHLTGYNPEGRRITVHNLSNIAVMTLSA